MRFEDMRKEYTQRGLSETDVNPDPFLQFKAWFDEIAASDTIEPNAMIVATATADGKPSARAMLLKGYDEAGFVFFTNYESRKGGELAANPWVALTFFWPQFERQIRIEGQASPVPAAESDAYFQSRPQGARLGAWTSPQSRVIPGRAALEARLQEVMQRYGEGDVPRPPQWGGYRVVPVCFEFWQGRLNRLHDRLRYQRGADGQWIIERLAP